MMIRHRYRTSSGSHPPRSYNFPSFVQLQLEPKQVRTKIEMMIRHRFRTSTPLLQFPLIFRVATLTPTSKDENAIEMMIRHRYRTSTPFQQFPLKHYPRMALSYFHP